MVLVMVFWHPSVLPQSLSPVGHKQTPLWQVVPGSAPLVVQSPVVVQGTGVAGIPHVPDRHVCGLVQTVPHPPQLLLSVFSSTHPVVGPQSMSEEFVHVQVPVWQVAPLSQTVPHVPQLLLSVSVFVHPVHVLAVHPLPPKRPQSVSEVFVHVQVLVLVSQVVPLPSLAVHWASVVQPLGVGVAVETAWPVAVPASLTVCGLLAASSVTTR